MSNFERDVANTMLDAADSRTAHEKTRIRQLEDAAAHWEHKYANARQYNRNLEAALKEVGLQRDSWKRIAESGMGIGENPPSTGGISSTAETSAKQGKERDGVFDGYEETACVHEWGEYSIDNAKSPADPPERYVWIKCIKCGEPQAATSNRSVKP